MKIKGIFALFTLIVMVKGAWWVAAMQPVILSLGAVFSAISLDLEPIEWRNWLTHFSEEDSEEEKEKQGLVWDEDIGWCQEVVSKPGERLKPLTKEEHEAMNERIRQGWKEQDKRPPHTLDDPVQMRERWERERKEDTEENRLLREKEERLKNTPISEENIWPDSFKTRE